MSKRNSNSLFTRRKTLGVIGTGSVMALAGCSDNGEESDTGEDPDGENGTENQTDGSENGSENGDTENGDTENGDTENGEEEPDDDNDGSPDGDGLSIVDTSGLENISQHAGGEHDVSITVENSSESGGDIYILFEYINSDGEQFSSAVLQTTIGGETEVVYDTTIFVEEGTVDVDTSAHVGEYDFDDVEEPPEEETDDEPLPEITGIDSDDDFNFIGGERHTIRVSIENSGGDGDIYILIEQNDGSGENVDTTVRNVTISGERETYQIDIFLREETESMNFETGVGNRAVTTE